MVEERQSAGARLLRRATIAHGWLVGWREALDLDTLHIRAVAATARLEGWQQALDLEALVATLYIRAVAATAVLIGGELLMLGLSA